MEEAFIAAKTAYEIYSAGRDVIDAGHTVLHHVDTVAKHPAYRSWHRAAHSSKIGLNLSSGLQGTYSKTKLKMPKRKYTGPDREARKHPYKGPGFTRTAGYYGRFTGDKGRMKEDKFFDTTLGFSCDLTAEVPVTGQLALVPQGTAQNQRVGRRITVHSMQIRGTLRYASGSSIVPGDYWIYVVQDRQANGAAASITDVLTGNSMRSALINISNSQRFRIIKRFTGVLTQHAGSVVDLSDDIHIVDWYKKCNIDMDFSSTTGALTEIRSNNLFLLAGATTSDDQVAFNGVCRIRFSD